MATMTAVLGMVSGAHAQAPAPDSDNGRFTFNQVPDGFLRLDSRTGQVSLCERRPVGWTCQAVPDDRTALEAEIVRLQSENAALKKEMIARAVPLPGGTKVNPPDSNRQSELKLPSDADVDRVMTFMERIWRRLIEMVQSVQKDMDRKG